MNFNALKQLGCRWSVPTTSCPDVLPEEKAMRLVSVHVFLMLTLLVLSTSGYAAGFDCSKAASAAEKAVCADNALSGMDSALSGMWKQTLAGGGDAATLKAAQRDWLKQRDACGSDKACLSKRYRERLLALGGALGPANRWQQTWKLDSDNPSIDGELTFTGSAPKLHFEIAANYGAHDGGINGDVELNGEHAHYSNDNGCQLDFIREGEQMLMKQKGDFPDCGAGEGVYYEGTYITALRLASKPKVNLLSLQVLADKTQNAAAHALLGKDYDVLVDCANVQGGGDDLDGLGVEVTTLWVNGLASTNAAIVMTRHDQLWIGLLVFDGDQLRMRYYSNVVAWKHRVPKTIQAWHDGNANKDIPIDMASDGAVVPH